LKGIHLDAFQLEHTRMNENARHASEIEELNAKFSTMETNSSELERKVAKLRAEVCLLESKVTLSEKKILEFNHNYEEKLSSVEKVFLFTISQGIFNSKTDCIDR